MKKTIFGLLLLLGLVLLLNTLRQPSEAQARSLPLQIGESYYMEFAGTTRTTGIVKVIAIRGNWINVQAQGPGSAFPTYNKDGFPTGPTTAWLNSHTIFWVTELVK
jgi:hypothetical protein